MPRSTLDLESQQNGLLSIFKGDSGVGKSVAAYSFPTPYVFDFDKKMPAIAIKHFPEKDIHFDTFNNIFEVQAQIEAFKRDCPYETLICDSITGLVNLCVDSVGEVKGESVPELLGRKTKSGAIEMMGIDYYSAEDRFCTWYIDQMKSLWARDGNPKHVIVIAHVVTVESSPDLKTKIVTRTRSIVSKGKKFPAWLPTGFDNVYIFGMEPPDMDSIDKTVQRICLTSAYGEDSAKCSYNFPEALNFTTAPLYEKLTSYGLPK